MFCIQCGQKLPNNAKFCNQCGEPCSATEYEDNVAGNAHWESIENMNRFNSKVDDDVAGNAHWDNGSLSSFPKEKNKDLSTYVAPEIIYFKVNKDYANEGECLFFSWEVKNVSKVVISIEKRWSSEVLQVIDVPDKAEVQAIFISFHAEESVQARLIIYDTLGNKIDYPNSLDIYKTKNSHPVILSFWADKYKIHDNETIELSWNVKNATRVTCSILKGELELCGEKTITISFGEEDPKKIYLYAENECGREESSLDIDLKDGFIITLVFGMLQIGTYGICGWIGLEILIMLLNSLFDLSIPSLPFSLIP